MADRKTFPGLLVIKYVQILFQRHPNQNQNKNRGSIHKRNKRDEFQQNLGSMPSFSFFHFDSLSISNISLIFWDEKDCV